jgi:hypothetical protein
MLKKIFLFFFCFGLLIGLAGCQKDNSKSLKSNIPQEVFETGRVLDISEKNDQAVQVVPGDVLYLNLSGEAESKKQWTVVSPTTGDHLLLKDQQVVGLNDKDILAGRFTVQYWFKILKTGEFNLQFDYGQPGKQVEKNFKVQVVSQ